MIWPLQPHSANALPIFQETADLIEAAGKIFPSIEQTVCSLAAKHRVNLNIVCGDDGFKEGIIGSALVDAVIMGASAMSQDNADRVALPGDE